MKRFIALVLSLVMALSLCAPAWAAGEVVVADTAALQDALYNAADGTTIQLKAGVNYGTVVFGRNAGSKEVDITALGGDAAGNEYYSKYENITILGAEGATVDQITFDNGREDANTIWNYIDVKNLTIKNVTFSGASTAVMIPDGFEIAIDGLSLVNCKMIDTEGNDRFVYQPHSGYKTMNDKTTVEYVMTSGVKNLTITGCVVEGAYQVIESRAMENLTITNNTFKGIKARDMLITSDVTNHPNATYTGTITITGNTSIGGEERFVRASLNNSDATLIIKDNTINNYMGEDDDYIKVDGIADGNTKVTIANNTLVTVAKVGDLEYTTLQEALNMGGTVELLGDIILAAPVAVTKDAVLDLKGFGITSTDTTSGVPIYVSSGKLTVRNGELALDGKETTIHGTYNCAIGYEPGTELVVDEVTFTGVTGINGTWKADGAVKISVSNSTFAVSNSGVVVSAGSKEAVATITNCTINAGKYAIFGSQGAQITVNGGNYTSNVAIYSQDAGTVVTVEGGTFTGALSEANNGKIVIKGGTFSVDPTPYVADGYYVTEADDKYVVHQIVATVGTVNYASLQDAVDAVDDKGTISVVVAGKSAVVNEAKTFTVTGNAATITAAEGYTLTVDGNKYTVEKPPVVVDPETEVTVEVAPPVVALDPELEKELEEDVEKAAVVNQIEVSDIYTKDMTDTVAEAAKNDDVAVTDEHVTELDSLFTEDVAKEDVVIVVQTNFEVEIQDVSVDGDKTTVTLDITPVYQHVATTQDVIDGNAKIEVGENAVALSEKKADLDLKGQNVEITIAIPEALVNAAASNGNKLYVTHTKDNGTSFVYEAEVNVTEKTATFVNPNGFSSFTLSATNSTVAYVEESGMSYASIESAISDAGKGAVIEVLVSDQVVNITAPCSFKLKWADNITEPKINVAKGYTVSKWYVNGVYTYIVQSASAGGYAPSTTPEKVVTSADTFDAGIALYVGMSVMAAAGSAVVLKKRED